MLAKVRNDFRKSNAMRNVFDKRIWALLGLQKNSLPSEAVFGKLVYRSGGRKRTGNGRCFFKLSNHYLNKVAERAVKLGFAQMFPAGIAVKNFTDIGTACREGKMRFAR